MVAVQNEGIFLEFVKNLLLDLRVDADLIQLSEYVLTIIKGDKTITELRGHCLDELSIFLNKHTETFVNKLMKSLDNDAYLDCTRVNDDPTDVGNNTTSEINENSDVDNGDNRKYDDLYTDLEYSNDDNNNAQDDKKDYITNNHGNYKPDTFNGYRGEYRGGRGGGRWEDRGGGRSVDRGGGRGGRGYYDARGIGYNGDQRGYNNYRYPYNHETPPIHTSCNKTIDPYDVMSFYPNNTNNNNDDNKTQNHHDSSHTGSYNNTSIHNHGTHADRSYTKRNYNSTTDSTSAVDHSHYSYKKPKTSVAALSYTRETGGCRKMDHTEIVLKKKLEEEGRIKNQYDEMKQLREQALEIRNKKMALMKKYKTIVSKLPATELSEEKQKLKETLKEKIVNLEKELSVE